MRDQLRFAEEDLGGYRKKLQDLETENEGMMRQLSKLTTGTSPGRPGRPPMKRSARLGDPNH